MVEPFAVVTFAGLVVTLVLAWLAWRARPNPGAGPLVAMTLALAVWNGTRLLATVTPSFAWSVVWSRLHFVGLTLAVPSLFALVLEYGGHDDLLTRRTVGLLLVEPVAVNLLVWTTDHHDLFFEYVPADHPSVADSALGGLEPTGVALTNLGPLFWLHAAYTWGLAVVSLGLVVRWWVRHRSLYRRQLGLLAAAILVSLVASVVDNTVALGVRLTEPAFVVVGALLTVAVVEFDFTDVTPVAHRTVLDQLTQAVVVLDDRNRVVNCNRAAKRLLAVDDSVIGEDLGTVLSGFPDVYERYADMSEGTDTVVVDTDRGPRHFRVEVTPLTGASDESLGRVFIVEDVTERHERKRRLERQNERLERFASLVSHDLRNPLGVAEGHLELARETDDEHHLQKIAESHDRMWAIIDDTLTMARESRTIEQRQPVSLPEAARDAWENVATGRATLDLDPALGDVVVDADRSRLVRVFENLFRNAVEHGSTGNQTRSDDAVEHSSTGSRTASDDAVEHGSTGSRTASDDAVEHGGTDEQAVPDGAVEGDAASGGARVRDEESLTVSVGTLSEPDDGAVVDLDRQGFYVADDGPGIPDGERDAVFETGYSTGDDGTGLGLVIVQSIVEAHGWKITAAESEDGGARFEISGVGSLRRGE
ncbi:MAG: histidine kinase N-terminal 7TM domain-containing protein [Haloarculaceae archaeon]